MGQLLSQPLTDKVIEYHEQNRFSYCLGSMQGYRLTQEDAHCFLSEPSLTFYDVDSTMSKIDVKIFGVFDGHGGSHSSEFISKTLARVLLQELSTRGNPLNKKTTQGLVIHRIKEAFLKADYELHQDISTKTIGQNSGSTAIVAIIINNTHLYSVNTGDSRMVVSFAGTAKNMSFDHKPNHIGELIRINDAGGMVTYNRVSGVLALSRAFGDFKFKKRGYYPEPQDVNQDDDESSGLESSDGPVITQTSLSQRQRLVSEETQVTVEPEIICHDLGLEDEFIILACDGIWDVFRNQDVVRFIRHNLSLGLKLDDITTKLLEHSLALADQTTGVGYDNMSIFIVACQQDGETLEEWYQRIKLKVEVEKQLI